MLTKPEVTVEKQTILVGFFYCKMCVCMYFFCHIVSLFLKHREFTKCVPS